MPLLEETFPPLFGDRKHSGQYNLPPGYDFDDDGGILDLSQNVQDMLAFRDDNVSRGLREEERFQYRPNNNGWGGEYSGNVRRGPLQFEALKAQAKLNKENQIFDNGTEIDSLGGDVGLNTVKTSLHVPENEYLNGQANVEGPRIGASGQGKSVYKIIDGNKVSVGVSAKGDVGAYLGDVLAEGEVTVPVTWVVNRMRALMKEFGEDKGPRHEYDLILNGKGSLGVGAGGGGEVRAGDVGDGIIGFRIGGKAGAGIVPGASFGAGFRRRGDKTIDMPVLPRGKDGVWDIDKSKLK